MTLLKQSIAILATFGFVFLWQNSPLASYTIPLLGFLIFIYVILSVWNKKMRNHIDTGGYKSVLVLNLAILLFIFSTGGLHSPLFFLLYFILFGIAFVFEPGIVIVFTLAVTALCIQQVIAGDIMGNLPKIASLYLFAPLAFFFGKEYKERYQEDKELDDLKEKSLDASTTIEKDAEEILKANPTLSTTDRTRLGEVIEEAEELRQRSK